MLLTPRWREVIQRKNKRKVRVVFTYPWTFWFLFVLMLVTTLLPLYQGNFMILVYMAASILKNIKIFSFLFVIWITFYMFAVKWHAIVLAII